jgi:hypothetical protein
MTKKVPLTWNFGEQIGWAYIEDENTDILKVTGEITNEKCRKKIGELITGEIQINPIDLTEEEK